MSRRGKRACASGGLGVAAAVWGALACAADSPWLTWEAPPECPTREIVLDRIRSIAKDSRGDDVAAQIRVEAADQGRWSARVTATVGGIRSERSLGGSSCEAVAEASALIVGLLLTPAPGPSETPPVSVPVARHAPVVLEPAVPETPAIQRGISGGLSFRAATAVDIGALPSPSPGAIVGAAWRVRPLEVGLEAAAFAAQGATVSGSTSGASVTLASASLDVCLAVPWGDRVVVAPCAGATLERLAATGFGAANAFVGQEQVALVPGALGELALEWSPLPVLAFRATARGIVPFARPTFVVLGPGGGEAGHPAAVALEPSLGLVVHLGK
jgi:hypothetical protein